MPNPLPIRNRRSLKSLAALLIAMLIAVPAFAQSTVSLLTGHVPPQLLEGTAKLVGHYNPSQKLRLVVGIRPPHQAEEEQFLTDLQTKGSPEFHHFLSADEWNSRFASSFSVCAGLLQAAFWLNFPISD